MKNFKLVKALVCILGLFILTACSAQSNIEGEQVEEEEKVYSSTQASIAETSPTPTPTIKDLYLTNTQQYQNEEYSMVSSESDLDTITRTVTSFAYSTEGAELMGVYSNNGGLQYLNVDILGEMGRRIYEYTFAGNSIIYTDTEILYSEPFYVNEGKTEIKEVNYKKYILFDGKMYEITDDKAMVQVSEELLLETEDMMEDFVRELEE